MLRRISIVSPIAMALALAVPAGAQMGGESPPDKANVEAGGNIVTGGLGFFPETTTVRVGGTVRWLNTDFIAPHTATEDHGLWDVGGTYGQTPVNPAGFPPGATVSRVFEAGTAKYYCRVHPTTMRATISVPVTLSPVTKRVVTKRRVRSRKTGRLRTVRRVRVRYSVDATWAPAAPAAGRVFDVELKRSGGTWQPLRTGTTETATRVSAGAKKGAVTAVRARLRLAADPNSATGWSPETSLTRP
jgi:plastocyanin